MTATPKRLLKALDARDGRKCMWHGAGCAHDILVPQHRANRGMGGRPSLMVLPNLLWVCSPVNAWMESMASWAAEARARGIKISTHADPEQVPVRYVDGWFLLTGNRRDKLTPDEAAELRALHGMEA